MLKNLMLLSIALSSNYYAQITKDDVLGKWMATNKTVAVHVYRDGTAFKAKVIWFDERLGNGSPMKTRVDSHNPDPKLRNVKVIGMDILQGLDYNPQNQHWENGKIYDASSGKTWDACAQIDEDGRLYVRGYWKLKCLGRSLYFTRIKDK